jgi:putative transposase
MYEVTKCAAQLAIKNDFASAAKHFLGKESFGFPNFRIKGRDDSFRIDYTALRCLDEISQGSQYLKIPNLEAPIKMAEALRYSGKIQAVVISRKADQWYAAFTVDSNISEIVGGYHFPESKNQAVGVDLGIANLAVLSDGTVIPGSKATRQYSEQLARAQKNLSRKKGSRKDEEKSRNYIEQQMKVARIHKRIADTRLDTLHKLTTFLAASYSVIGIEDLNIRGMLANHKLAKHIADGGFYEFKRQLRYKADVTGAKIVMAGAFFPSSKTCSGCGAVYESLKLSEREWVCPSCGIRHDRDVNAYPNKNKIQTFSQKVLKLPDLMKKGFNII